MFRYLALAWDTDAEGPCAAARRLAAGLRDADGWPAALDRPGLLVFTSGERPGVNQGYPLNNHRGVVLGKLFGRHGAPTPVDHFCAHPDESAAIVATGAQPLIERHWGRYVAFLESPDGGFRVLRDPSGTLPCYHLDHEGVDVVFSWLEDVLELLPSVPQPAVSWEHLVAHLGGGELTGRPTALEGIRQVMAGELVPVGGHRESARFAWKASDHACLNPLEDAAVAAGALRRTVMTCARSWASCYDALILRLSGGVDSSILAACLSDERTSARVTCLNYHSPGADSDERPYARLAAARARRELVELERDEGFRLERVLDVAPTPNPSNYLGRLVAQMDADLASMVGAQAMFTGAGGDQLFFEFYRWWPAADYLRLRGIDRGLPGALMDAARLGRVSLWSAAGHALADRFRVRPPSAPLDRPWALATEALWARPRHAEAFHHPAFADAAGLPIGKLMQVQQLTHVGGYYDPYQRAAAPELVNPLFSQPLIELCLRIPTYLLARDGRPRGLVRQAFSDDLPPEIVRRRSKGGLQELISAVLQRNLDFARQILLDGQLVRQGLLDRRRVESALAGGPGAAPGQAGEIHMFIGVEAWLQRCSAPRRPPA